MSRTGYDEAKLQADALGFLRFSCAVFIIIFHYNKMPGGAHDDPRLPLYAWLRLPYVYGGELVELFFIVSGFVFCLFYKERIAKRAIGAGRFIIHRLGRLLPSYWLSTLVIVGAGFISRRVLGSFISFAGGSVRDLKSLPFDLLCLNFWDPVNGVAWYLAVNIICYALFFWFFRISNSAIRYSAVVISIAASVLYVVAGPGNSITNIARGIAAFGVGIGVAYVCRRSSGKKTVIITALVLLTASVVILCITRSFRWITEVFLLYPSVLILMTNWVPLRKIVSVKLFQTLGNYSYCIYICQTAVMGLIFLLGGVMGFNNWYTWYSFIFVILSIVVVGIVMYYIWDTPMRKRMNKLEDKINERF